jgi:hypothetical protein
MIGRQIWEVGRIAEAHQSDLRAWAARERCARQARSDAAAADTPARPTLRVGLGRPASGDWSRTSPQRSRTQADRRIVIIAGLLGLQ